MAIYQSTDQSDITRKAAIVDFLTRAAAEGGREAVASAPKAFGPQTMSAIRSAIGGLTSECTRLVNALVDAGTIIRKSNGSENANNWTYTVE
jgi:hypothetical protein